MGANFGSLKTKDGAEVAAPKVTLGDANHMKRVLDDALVKVRSRYCDARLWMQRWLSSWLVLVSRTRGAPQQPFLSPSPPRVQKAAACGALHPTHKPLHPPPPPQCFEEHAPFEEDYRWGNAKLLIMALASAAALVAQFAPVPFPDNRALLGVCVVIYFALSGVLQYIVTFLDKDILYSGKLSGSAAGGSQAPGSPVAVLRTKLPRASQNYSVILEFPRGTEVASLQHSVGRYFDSTGALAMASLSRDVKALADGCAGAWKAQMAAGATGGGKGAPVVTAGRPKGD